MSPESEDLTQLFRQETNAILDALGGTLLRMEEDGAAADARTEALRHFHTLKGMANMEGHPELARLCHEAEATLAQEADPPVDVLLRRVDDLRAWLQRHGLGARKEDEVESAAYVSVQTERLDTLLNVAGELTVTTTRLLYEERAGKAAPETLRTLGRLVRSLQDEVMKTRLLPARTLLAGLPRLARDAARARGVQVDLEFDEGNIGVDRSTVDRLSGVLAHLVQNSVAHGIEPPEERRARGKPPRGRVRISLQREQETIRIEVADDGRGLAEDAVRAQAVARGLWTQEAARGAAAAELPEVVFAPGFSTSGEADAHAGRGIGLTAVRETVRELGGSVQLASTPGEGTRVTLHLPPTVALLDTLVARASDATVALPVRSVQRIHDAQDAVVVGDALMLLTDGGAVPVMNVQGQALAERAGRFVVVARASHGTFGLAVDELLGTHASILKPLDPTILARHASAMGAAVLGSGTLAIILDPNHFRGKE